ncbi:membrane fusion protein, multidrug efflux system [Onishia taeanensis]|uniref:Membrane fusion protein, multidrug efflux system n=1 Tax=Onishia taeanensis TaxID=284577 RepID=A0A1G7QBT8_9GAMM|nr:efflux RND transporter periplasmic adaptor subunit [Halomonas taeanensis]MAX33779.1 efflux RND transporter periplasmic adaptor subunit [Halomonadaceae bacterium]SDF95918.1 membrane fusion protein, multidrug efflux system [Halomonas taeanensis]
MKTTIRLVIVVIVLTVALGSIFGWKYLKMQEMAAQNSQAQPPTPVEAVTIESQSWRPGLSSVGSLRAINGVEVANEVAGVVSEVDFESGQRVSKGDVLIRLEDSVDQAALAALEAQAQLTNETYQRYSNLLPRNAVSQSQFDEARANYQAARADAEQQRAQLNKKTIRAPFDGVVGLRQVDLGEYIAVGTPIVDLNMLDPIHVDYSVPERALDRVAAGRSIELTVAAYPGRVFKGEILAIAPSINESSRTVNVRAKLDNADGALHPGMFAEVSTLSADTRNVLTLPRTALSFNTYGDFVFRIVENDQGQTIASRQQVKTGNTRGDVIEITDGLSEGDQVVATGLLRLRDGQPVKVSDQSASESQAANADEEAQG